MSHAQTKEPEIMANVQYVPCGCCGLREKKELLNLAPKQMENIATGKKLDAVTLPTSQCPTCQSEW